MLSRRNFLASVPLAAVGSSIPLLGSAPSASAQAAPNPLTLLGDVEILLHSLEGALTFLRTDMDAYATGTTLRLLQSYSDGGLLTTAFTYDNAVAIHALLATGRPAEVERAAILGASLLYAQANNFPFADGRFAQAYFVGTPDANGAYITPAAYPFYFYGSAVGDQAWAGMALAQLYRVTGESRFLAGALLVANWIVANTYDTTGLGGYTFGTIIDSNNQSQRSPNGKSTEHNIDTYAFFTMLAALTGGTANNGMSWQALAQHAYNFVASLWNSEGSYFYTGTDPDGATITTSPVPEDCQTWSYMAALANISEGSIEWALANLQATDTASSPRTQVKGAASYTGMVFDTASLTTTTCDPDAVWLEGTAHTIAALLARILRGGDGLPAILADLQSVVRLLATCLDVQAQLGAGQTFGGKPLPAGQGLVAATSTLDTGFGYTYGNSVHVGATAWYLLAGLAANPFQLGYRVIG